MKLNEYVDIDQLHEMIIAKMVMVNYHPNGYLRILTYSKECQEEHIWNDTTEKCRGLIVDGDNNILARPFKKFYNYEELIADGFPIDKYLDENMAFDAYDKLDGSLGILYWINDTPYIATRGRLHLNRHYTLLNFCILSIEIFGISLIEIRPSCLRSFTQKIFMLLLIRVSMISS